MSDHSYMSPGDFHRTITQTLIPTGCDRCPSRPAEISRLQTHRQALLPGVKNWTDRPMSKRNKWLEYRRGVLSHN
ncbi:hypothetical protein V3C99_004807 [Haemonchus contortus]|uniref:Uncharacterized protein n=1 Tax=Haemonchus contortus TaxID=6289 RepID=A0A7I5E5K6_HAECO|nr:unnamed protein product [Haemonchus contortus]